VTAGHGAWPRDRHPLGSTGRGRDQPAFVKVWNGTRRIELAAGGDRGGSGLSAGGGGSAGEAELRRLVERGDLDAARQLAALLVDSDRSAEAARCFEMLAESGDAEGAYNRGVLELHAGRKREAELWFRQAAKGGHAKSALALGSLLQGSGRIEEGTQWVERGLRAGGAAHVEFVGTADWADVSAVVRSGADPQAAYEQGHRSLVAGTVAVAERWFQRQRRPATSRP
jgi:hypothetical protein